MASEEIYIMRTVMENKKKNNRRELYKEISDIIRYSGNKPEMY